MSGNGEIMSAIGQNIGVASRETLSQRVETAFREAVASRLDGKVPEKTSVKVNAAEDGHHPVLTFLIQDRYSGTKTTVEIPVGRSNPQENSYYARIYRNNRPQSEGYEEFSSPEHIGEEAAKVFSHHYTVDVMGL